MPLELGLETLMALVGIVVYWKIAGQDRSAVGRYGMTILVLLFTAMTWSQLALTKSPKPQQLNISWIVVPLILSAIAYGLDYRRAGRAKLGQIPVSNP
jgi:hypothetical protein